MKIIKGLAIFSFLAIILGACFDEPEFSVIPEIEFGRVEFVEGKTSRETDSLIITFDFRDGDGDLGVDPLDDRPPFNETNFFLYQDNGDLSSVPVATIYSDLEPLVLPEGQLGKLVTVRTRELPGFESLPAYSPSASCQPWKRDTVHIFREDTHVIGDSYAVPHPNPDFAPEITVVYDTFYYELNPNRFNIEVDFLLKEVGPTGVTWTEYEWPPCAGSYDGKFPIVSETRRATEGTIKYSLQSTQFLALFSIRTLKLRIKIRDRSLNESNVIESPEFTLEGIRK